MLKLAEKQEQDTYITLAEDSSIEIAGLMHHDRLLIQEMGSPLSECSQSEVEHLQAILDLNCGPGGWAMDVAYQYPKVQVMGIDLSQVMIDYARAQAWSQGLENAHFKAVDTLRYLDFPDASFDLINGRQLFHCLRPEDWPTLLHECMRILRSGGVIRLTEGERPISNSLAVEQLNLYFTRAFARLGRSFSPDGYHIGILPVMGLLLRDAGYRRIRRKTFSIDYSASVGSHPEAYGDILMKIKAFEPFLSQLGIVDTEEFERLYRQAWIDVYRDTYCAIGFYQTVWGVKI